MVKSFKNTIEKNPVLDAKWVATKKHIEANREWTKTCSDIRGQMEPVKDDTCGTITAYRAAIMAYIEISSMAPSDPVSGIQALIDRRVDCVLKAVTSAAGASVEELNGVADLAKDVLVVAPVRAKVWKSYEKEAHSKIRALSETSCKNAFTSAAMQVVAKTTAAGGKMFTDAAEKGSFADARRNNCHPWYRYSWITP